MQNKETINDAFGMENEKQQLDDGMIFGIFFRISVQRRNLIFVIVKAHPISTLSYMSPLRARTQTALSGSKARALTMRPTRLSQLRPIPECIFFQSAAITNR